MVLGIGGVLVAWMEFHCPSVAWVSHASKISQIFSLMI